jgi:hypothetical protein
MKSIVATALVTTLFSGYASGVSLVYQGFECQNAVNADDTTPSEKLIESKFEVIDDVGGGMFHLSLTGGLPRFINDNSKICIDNDTAIGFSGIPKVDGLPTRLDAIDATAYFNGQDLIIIVNSINTDLNSGRGTFSKFTTSFVFPFSNTLILTYNPESSSFTLKKTIHNRGFIHTSGSATSITPFAETILPSFNESENDQPRILTPASLIEYRLE